MSSTKPQRAIILARISDDRNGDEHGVTGQVADGRKLARRLGWRIGPDATHVVVENDTSAYKRHKVRLPDGRSVLRTDRPGFRGVLDLLATGGADGLICLDLDRVARDPRDLEDLIDVIESKVPRIPVESVTGSLKLANDADVTMARVMVAVANKSSRDSSRRIKGEMLRLAQAGRWSGGARPYGHELDGSARPDEAKVIVEAAEAILSGVGVRGMARELNAQGRVPPRGGHWTHATLRELLLQPRIAGLASYHGEVLEDVEAWCLPILDRPQWEAVGAVLKDPGRRVTPGPTPRHLLSHLALCGHPSHADGARPALTHGWAGGGRWRVASYRCQATGHLACASHGLEQLVVQHVIERLSRPDAADLLVPRTEVDVAGLAKESNSLRARITALGDALENGSLSATEHKVRRDRLEDKLAKVQDEMIAAAGMSPLVGIAGRQDVAEVWTGLDLARKKAVIDALMVVTVLPARRRGKDFDPDRLRIDWRMG
jgi:DNA invertase Pin-like site-specific DNA recombinase